LCFIFYDFIKKFIFSSEQKVAQNIYNSKGNQKAHNDSENPIGLISTVWIKNEVIKTKQNY